MHEIVKSHEFNFLALKEFLHIKNILVYDIYLSVIVIVLLSYTFYSPIYLTSV